MHENTPDDFSFKKLFVPLTTFKAIHWLGVVGIIVFFNSLFNGFVLDDAWQIINNRAVHSLANIPLFFSGGTFSSGGGMQLLGDYYRPLMALYFSFVYSLFGASPFPYHLFQVVLHIANAILVFLLFKQFFAKSLSFFLALLFLVHPINQEAVVYISDIQDILFFFFGMLAILIAKAGRQNRKRVFLITLFFLFSLLSKEAGIVFALFIISIPWVTKKTVNVYTSVWIVLLSGCYLLFRFFILQFIANPNAAFPIMKLTLVERMLSMPAIIFYYISTFFYPQNLSVQQVWTIKTIDFQHFYIPLLTDIFFFLLIGYLGFYISKQNKKHLVPYLFFFAWFLIGISLYVQIMPLQYTVATRWFYFPIVGLLGLIGLSLQNVKRVKKSLLHLGYVVAIIIIIALSVRTVIRNTNWNTALALYSHDIQLADNYISQNNLGSELLYTGQPDKAVQYLEKSVKTVPTWWNLTNLAEAYFLLGENDKAITLYKKSLRYGEYFRPYEGLTSAYLVSGNMALAKQYSVEGLKRFPLNATLWFYYGLAEYESGDKQIAIQAMQRSIALDKTNDQRMSALNKMMNNQPINLTK